MSERIPDEVCILVFDASESVVGTSITPYVVLLFLMRSGDVSVPTGSHAILTVPLFSRIRSPQSMSVTTGALTSTVTLSEALPPVFEHERV